MCPASLRDRQTQPLLQLNDQVKAAIAASHIERTLLLTQFSLCMTDTMMTSSANISFQSINTANNKKTLNTRPNVNTPTNTSLQVAPPDTSLQVVPPINEITTHTMVHTSPGDSTRTSVFIQD